MSTEIKLTKPQLELLRDLNITTVGSVCEGFRPARKLVELGLAEWSKGYFSEYLIVTEKGKQVWLEIEGRNAAKTTANRPVRPACQWCVDGWREGMGSLPHPTPCPACNGDGLFSRPANWLNERNK